jgi:hypothetical protein
VPLAPLSADVFLFHCSRILDLFDELRHDGTLGLEIGAGMHQLNTMLEAAIHNELDGRLNAVDAKDLWLRLSDTPRFIEPLKKRNSRIEAVQEALTRMEENFSLLGAKLKIIFQTSAEHPGVKETGLKPPKRTFEDVAKRASELTEDMRSLEPAERVKIAEILRIEVESALLGSATSLDVGPTDFPYPVLPSSYVLSEGTRRKAPKQKWLERDRALRQTPVEFIQAVYSDLLGRGFTQADLKACDKSLYDALHQWLQKTDPETGRRNAVPADLDLPSIEDWNARRVRQLRLYPNSIDDEERQRLSYVVAGRAYRGNAIK